MQRLYYLLTFDVIGTHSLSLLSNSSQNSWCFVSRLSGNQCELTQENACSALRGGRPPACAKRKRLKLAATQWRYNISTSSSEIHQKTLDICCLLLPRAMTPSSKGSRLSFSREFLQFSIQCGPGWSLIPAGNNVKGFLCTALQVAFWVLATRCRLMHDTTMSSDDHRTIKQLYVLFLANIMKDERLQ